MKPLLKHPFHLGWTLSVPRRPSTYEYMIVHPPLIDNRVLSVGRHPKAFGLLFPLVLKSVWLHKFANLLVTLIHLVVRELTETIEINWCNRCMKGRQNNFARQKRNKSCIGLFVSLSLFDSFFKKWGNVYKWKKTIEDSSESACGFWVREPFLPIISAATVFRQLS